MKKIKRLTLYYLENIPLLTFVVNWWVIVLGYVRLLDLSTGVLLYLRNGMRFMVVHHLDALAIREVIGSNEYRFTQGANSMTIVDIGANIGSFSVMVAKENTNNRVISFEPSPTTYRQLKKNICINDVENIEVFQKAVYSKKSTLRLYDNGMSGQRSIYSAGRGKRYVEVETDTLENIIKALGLKKINFLKMDCEGSEYEILLAVKKTTFKKIDTIALEYHEIKRGQKKETLVNILIENGYKVEVQKHNIEENIGYIWAKH